MLQVRRRPVVRQASPSASSLPSMLPVRFFFFSFTTLLPRTFLCPNSTAVSTRKSSLLRYRSALGSSFIVAARAPPPGADTPQLRRHTPWVLPQPPGDAVQQTHPRTSLWDPIAISSRIRLCSCQDLPSEWPKVSMRSSDAWAWLETHRGFHPHDARPRARAPFDLRKRRTWCEGREEVDETPWWSWQPACSPSREKVRRNNPRRTHHEHERRERATRRVAMSVHLRRFVERRRMRRSC